MQRALCYRKFAGATVTVLVFDSGYHLQAECMAALVRMGHKVVRVPINGAGARDGTQAMRRLLQALLAAKPDMVLSINHIGFDTDSVMGELLAAVNMPVAVWYVDSPFLIHDGYFLAAPEVTSVFVWERAYVPVLRGCGAVDVHYLPLACDMSRFATGAANAPTTTPVGFVGSSMRYNRHKWKETLPDAALPEAHMMAEDLARDPTAFMRLLGQPRPTPDRRMSQLAYATFMATGAHRNALLQRYDAGELTVVGDPGWQEILPKATFCPQVLYGPPLAAMYRQFAVNLNITSMQMPTAVNQRVFDVPAAGGFVLTDARDDLHDLFDDDALAVFGRDDDMLHMARFYVAHPRARQRIVDRARACVQTRHTYEHRLGVLLRTVQQRHS